MNQPAAHPINLESLFFTRSSVICIPGYRPVQGKIPPGPENSINVSKIEGHPGLYSMTMRSVMNPKQDESTPYSIDMECFTVLRVDETLTEEEARRGVTITGNSILFGAIRETVAWLTARQPNGSLLLGLSVLKINQDQQPADK